MSVSEKSRDFDSFNPRHYLDEYYADLGAENIFLLNQFAKAYAHLTPDSSDVLEVGGGPTIYQLISLTPVANKIYFTDYLQANLDEVVIWMNGDAGAFNWDEYIKQALEIEKVDSSVEQVQARKEILRQKLATLTTFDLFKPDLLVANRSSFDVVSSVFSTDAITSSKEEWSDLIMTLSRFVKRGGSLVLAGTLGSDEWVSGEQKFGATRLTIELVHLALSDAGLKIDFINTIDAEDGGAHGYESIFFVKATK